MRFAFQGDDWRIRFQYGNIVEDEAGNALWENPAGRGHGRHPNHTMCFLERWDEFERKWLVEEVGESWCNQQDQFVKEVGRKLSLLRALEESDHALRTTACNTYFKRFL
jgi:hypothetical protein